MKLKSFSNSLEREEEAADNNDGHQAEYKDADLPSRHQPSPTVETVVAFEALVVSLSHDETVLHHQRVVSPLPA